MNRILSIAILLLTLLTAAEVKAQPMTNETGYKCNDGGFEYISPIPCDYVAACREQCSSCDNFFDCDEIVEHEKDCYYECPLCNEQMPVNEQGGHHCESTCGVCGMPMTQCVCHNPNEGNDPYSGGGGNGFPNQYLPNVTVKGKNKSGSSLNWWEIVTIGGSATPSAGGGGGSNGNSDDSKVTGSEQEYTFKETDHLSVNIKILNNLKGFKQGTNNTCVCAGAEFIAKALGNSQITEGTTLTALVKEFGFGVMFGSFSTSNRNFDSDKLCRTLSDHAISNGLQATSNITDFKSAIDEGYLIMADHLVSSGIDAQTGKAYKNYHDVVITGYNDEGLIIYDTDISAGKYKVYPVEELGVLYSVGIKK